MCIVKINCLSLMLHHFTQDWSLWCHVAYELVFIRTLRVYTNPHKCCSRKFSEKIMYLKENILEFKLYFYFGNQFPSIILLFGQTLLAQFNWYVELRFMLLSFESNLIIRIDNSLCITCLQKKNSELVLLCFAFLAKIAHICESLTGFFCWWWWFF